MTTEMLLIIFLAGIVVGMILGASLTRPNIVS